LDFNKPVFFILIYFSSVIHTYCSKNHKKQQQQEKYVPLFAYASIYFYLFIHEDFRWLSSYCRGYVF